MDNTKPQTYGDAGSAILSKLIQLSQQANPVNMGMNVGYAATQGLGQALNTPVGQNPVSAAVQGIAQNMNQIGPYQKGVNKALASAGETHATEALAAGVPPQAIQNHPIMQQPTPTQQQETPQTSSQVQTAPQPQPQQQTQGQNPLQILSGLLGNFGQGAGQAMMNSAGVGNFQNQMANAQLTRQQTQNITPQGALALKTAEAAAPPTSFEKSQLAGAGYQAQVQAINDELSKVQADKQNIVEQMKMALDLRNPLQKVFGQEPNMFKDTTFNTSNGPVKMSGLKSTLMSLNQKESQIHGKMVSMFGKQPNFNQQQNQQQSDNSPFQVGQKFQNGETITNVKKIG